MNKELVDQKEAIKWKDILTGAIKEGKKAMLIVARSLWELRENDKFKSVYGDMSWAEFLAQEEIGFSRSTADRYVDIYQWLVLKYKLDESSLPTDTKKVWQILPIIKRDNPTKEEVKQLIGQAQRLSRGQLKEELTNHEHSWEERTFLFCSECGTIGKRVDEPVDN